MCAHTVSRSVSRAASPCPARPCLASACVSMCAWPKSVTNNHITFGSDSVFWISAVIWMPPAFSMAVCLKRCRQILGKDIFLARKRTHSVYRTILDPVVHWQFLWCCLFAREWRTSLRQHHDIDVFHPEYAPNIPATVGNSNAAGGNWFPIYNLDTSWIRMRHQSNRAMTVTL